MSKLEHRTLSSAISARIRDEILSGARPAGTQLRQEALAVDYGVSRIPVREALFQLEAEGLIQIVPHKGAIVASLSLEEINDVFDLRIMLEVRLLAAALPRMGDEDFARLEAIQSAFVEAVSERNIRRWGELNADFHLALYAGANLPRTITIVTALLQTSDRYTRVQLSSPQAMLRAQSEHKTLIDLCKSKASEAACALLAQHIGAVRDDLVKLVRARGEPVVMQS